MEARVFVHVLGLPNVHKLKINKSSPLRHLFAHIPAQTYAPQGALGNVEFYWNDIKLDPGKCPADYEMDAGEANVQTIFVHYPMASPKSRNAPGAVNGKKQLSPVHANGTPITTIANPTRKNLTEDFTAEETPLVETPREEHLTPMPLDAITPSGPDQSMMSNGVAPAAAPVPTPAPLRTVSFTSTAASSTVATNERARSPISDDLLGQYVRKGPTTPLTTSLDAPAAAVAPQPTSATVRATPAEEKQRLAEKQYLAMEKQNQVEKESLAVEKQRWVAEKQNLAQEKENLVHANEDLDEENRMLAQENKTLANEKQKLSKENEDLRAQLHQLRDQVGSFTQDNEALTVKLSEFRSGSDRAVTDERAAKEAALERVEHMKERVARLDDELKEQQQALRAATRESDHARSLRAQCERYTAETEVLRQELDEANRRADEFRDSAEAARVRIRDLETKEREAALHATRTLDSRHADEMKRLQQQLSTVENRISAKDTEIDQFKQLLREKDREIQRLHLESNNKDKNAQAAAKKGEEDAVALDKYMEKFEAAQQEIEKMNTERGQLQEQCKKYLSEASAASKNALRFQEELAKAEKEIDAQREDIQMLEHEIKATERNAEMRNDERMSMEMSELRRSHQKLMEENEKLNETLKRNMDGRGEAEADVERLRSKLARVSETTLQVEKEAELEKDELRTELQREREEMEALRHELAAQRDATEKLDRFHKEDKDESTATLRQQLASMQDEMVELNLGNRKSKETIIDLETALVECNEAMMKLRRENNDMRARLRGDSGRSISPHRRSGDRESSYVTPGAHHRQQAPPPPPPSQHHYRDPRDPYAPPPQSHQPSNRTPSHHSNNSRSSSVKGDARDVVVLRDARVTVQTTPGGVNGHHYASDVDPSGYTSSSSNAPYVSNTSPRVGRARIPGGPSHYQ